MSKLSVNNCLRPAPTRSPNTQVESKDEKYVYGERNGIYIIDLQQTLPMAEKAYEFLKKTSQSGKSVLFVGTRQASDMVKKTAENCGAYRYFTLANWNAYKL